MANAHALLETIAEALKEGNQIQRELLSVAKETLELQRQYMVASAASGGSALAPTPSSDREETTTLRKPASAVSDRKKSGRKDE